MDSKRIIVDTVDNENKPLRLAIIRPTNKINQEANMAYNLKMAELIRKGSQDNSQRLLLRSELEEYLTELGIWTAKDVREVEKLAFEIRAHELVLKKGGIKVSEGRAIALKMAEKRQMILEKHSKRLQFDSITIESQAENFRFEFLLTKCLVKADTGTPFVKNLNEYAEQEDTTAVIDGAKVLANMIYGLEDNVNKNMFEIKWLKDAGMINEKGQYTLPDGKLVDRIGRLVNDSGRYINAEGQMVDTFARPVDEHGNPLVDVSQPFIDDKSGEDVVIGDVGKKTKTKNKKRKKTTRIKRKT